MSTDSTRRSLRAALDRLINGTPVRTDGRLAVTGLAREAGVNRATAYRHHDVITDLKAAAERPHTAAESQRHTDPKLLERLERLARTNTVLRAEKEALANAVYALTGFPLAQTRRLHAAERRRTGQRRSAVLAVNECSPSTRSSDTIRRGSDSFAPQC